MSGSGFLDLTYDFHGQSTFAYANSPTNVQVPFSTTRYSTFSLTGSVKPIDKLSANFGLYNTNWTVDGEQPTLDSSGNVTGTTGLDRTVSRFDPHVAFVYRADRNTSIRAATGTSETFPFVGDVSGPAAVQPAAFQYTAGIVTEKNANLQPEYSIAYDLGADHRFANGSVLSFDLQDTIVHNVFQDLTTQETVTNVNGTQGILGIFKPINVARLEAKLLTLKYTYAPVAGFGYNFALTADSSELSGIPASAYNSSAALPADNVQVCGNAAFTPGLATCIPYLKGYGQLTFQFAKGTFVALGADYEGKNNAYYQPPFAIADFVFHQPLNHTTDFNLSVENLFNTNSYDYLPAPGLGTPAVADTTSNGTSIQQTTYSTYRLPAATRTLHVSVRAHVGKK
jgi:outer membrane receptor protein involved in Fe transport